jgi:type VI secretion system protein ImpB
VAFTVANSLTGEGHLTLDVTFESLDDFSPAAIAKKVAPLKAMLDARTELNNLLSYMDGKVGAEDLIAKVLNDPALMKTLASAPNPAVETSQEG